MPCLPTKSAERYGRTRSQIRIKLPLYTSTMRCVGQPASSIACVSLGRSAPLRIPVGRLEMPPSKSLPKLAFPWIFHDPHGGNLSGERFVIADDEGKIGIHVRRAIGQIGVLQEVRRQDDADAATGLHDGTDRRVVERPVQVTRRPRFHTARDAARCAMRNEGRHVATEADAAGVAYPLA